MVMIAHLSVSPQESTPQSASLVHDPSLEDMVSALVVMRAVALTVAVLVAVVEVML